MFNHTLRCFLITLPLILLIESCTRQEQLPQRPNILFIMADDHAYQAISAYDDRLISTPNIDRIKVLPKIWTIQ